MGLEAVEACARVWVRTGEGGATGQIHRGDVMEVDVTPRGVAWLAWGRSIRVYLTGSTVTVCLLSPLNWGSLKAENRDSRLCVPLSLQPRALATWRQHYM